MDAYGFPSNGRTERENQNRAGIYQALINAGLGPLAERYRLCQSTDPDNIVGWHICSDDSDHPHQPIVRTCHLHLACEECARRATTDLIKRYRPVIHHYGNKNSAIYHFQWITLPTQIKLHDPNARVEIKKTLKKASQLFDKVLGSKWYNKGQGYISICQFGFDGQLFHIHLIFYGRPIKWKEIQPIWHKLSGYKVIHLRRLPGAANALEKLAYATKFVPFADGDIPVLLKVMKGQRRISSRGIFYNHGFEKERNEKRCRVCNQPVEFYSRRAYDAWQKERDDHPRTAQDTVILINGNKSFQNRPTGPYPAGCGPPHYQSSYF